MTRIGALLSPLLVGRDDLLALVDRQIGEAAAGRGRLLLLAGEAGIGKTRMVDTIIRKARAAGFRISKGDLAPDDRQVPLASILDLARTMRDQAAFGALGRELLDLPEAIRSATGNGTPSAEGGAGGDALGHRRTLVREAADRIIASSDDSTLLAFEDLQWADELSLEVIGELARLAADRPILLVGSYRVEDLPAGSIQREWRARLVTQRVAEEARLGRLTYDETALVTTLILGTGLPAPREVVSAVYERTNGIPLHVEELLAALDERARTDGRAIRDAVVPDTIEDAVLARAGRLSDDARAVARAGAVIGRCFTPDALAGVMNRAVTDLDAPLDELVSSSFLFPFGLPDRGYFDFRHQLLRDALYASVPTGELRRLHARAGEFGVLLEGASEIHASVHYERAGLRAQAFRAALAGAREAARLSSHREAFELYRRAVDNAPADLEPADRATMLEGYGFEAAAVEDHDTTRWTAEKARELYLAAGRRIDAARMASALAALGRRLGEPVDARIELVRSTLGELEGEVRSAEVDEARAELLVTLGVMQIDAHDLDAARRSIRAALALTASPQQAELRLDGESWLAVADVVGGRAEAGLAAIDRVALEARQQGYESVSVTAYRNAALLAVQVMDYERAAVSLREGMRYADSIEQSHCRDIMRVIDAHVAWADGRWDEAVAMAEQGLADGGGGARAAALAHWALAFVALGRNQVERARSALAEADALGRRAGAIDLVLPGLWGFAETALTAGDAQGAIERCEEAFGLAAGADERPLFVPFVVTGVRAYYGAGRPAAAEAWLERCAAHLADAPIACPALDHARGFLRLGAGATVAARDLLEAAVCGWDERGRTWEAAQARIDLARGLARSGRAAAALELLGEARATATRVRSDALLARIDELARSVRGRTAADGEPWRPLTAREFEVARHIADGLTNGEIATALGIAPKTASAHVEHILAKLGLTRRAEIAAWASRIDAAAANGRTAAPREGATATA